MDPLTALRRKPDPLLVMIALVVLLLPPSLALQLGALNEVESAVSVAVPRPAPIRVAFSDAGLCAACGAERPAGYERRQPDSGTHLLSVAHHLGGRIQSHL